MSLERMTAIAAGVSVTLLAIGSLWLYHCTNEWKFKGCTTQQAYHLAWRVGEPDTWQGCR